MTMVQPAAREADARHGAARASDLDPRGRPLPAARVAGRGRAGPPRRARPDRATCRRRASATPTCTGAPAACTSASCATRSPRRSRRATGAGRAACAGREGMFEACIAAIPYAPATAFLANEQAKLAAIPDGAGPPAGLARRRQPAGGRRAPAGGDPRRRHRLDARGDAHDRGDPPRGVPGYRDRGGRHRPGGRPPPRRPWRRSTCPSTRACGSACPACPAAVRDARPRAATRRSTSARPGPPGSPARSWPAPSACRWSAATTPS